jgi:hypothetical protein
MNNPFIHRALDVVRPSIRAMPTCRHDMDEPSAHHAGPISPAAVGGGTTPSGRLIDVR